MPWTRWLAVFLSALFLGSCFGGKPGEQHDSFPAQARSPVDIQGAHSRNRTVEHSGVFRESPEQKSCSLQSPVRLELGLASAAYAANPLELTTRVTTTVPIHAAEIALILPTIGNRPSVKTTLWSGEVESMTFREVNHHLPPLPAGKHIVTVSMLLETDVRGLASEISRKLYIDVRKNKVAWSDISFNYLAMKELKTRIKELGLAGLSFEQLKKTAPGLASRVEELHDFRSAQIRPASSLKGEAVGGKASRDSAEK